MNLLDRVIRETSRLPCSRFTRECPDDAVIDFWFSRVRLLGDVDSSRLAMVARTPKLPVEGVHRICDPDRTQYLYELFGHTHQHRRHIEWLLSSDSDPLACSTLQRMTESIMACFPPGGLQSTSATELVALFVHSAST